MPFDNSLVLHDGTTITADITPTSEARASGSASIDLQEGQVATGGGIKDMAAVLIMGADLAETSDTLQVSIEACATVDGTYVELARFPLLTKGTGMPGTYIIRFGVDPSYRYVRGNIDVTDADTGSDFSVANCYLLLSPYPYYNL